MRYIEVELAICDEPLQEVSMINVNLPRPAVRLLIGQALQAQLNEMDEDRYEVLQQAIEFAEDAIATRLAAEGELPQFLVPFDTLELVIVFCRLRERFVVRAIIELGDDPPPSASSSIARETPAESLLRAAGIEARRPDWSARPLSADVAEVLPWPLAAPAAATAIRVVGDGTGFEVVLALGRLGLSGSFVTLTPGDAADAVAAGARFCAPANSLTAAATPSVPADGEGTPPLASGASAPGTSTDP
jgi:hypothetical protein